MAEFNESEKKLILKIVYYGPALSGKTTNLIWLHNSISPEKSGELMSLDTKGDRTLFFDLLPLAVTTQSNFMVKFKLFTVPGQVAHDATRKAVLSRADGVVFVADSQKNQAVNNNQSFENLENNAQRTGLDFDTLPLVVQFNKRDLDGIESEEDINQLWGGSGIPVFFSSAISGKGVAETFRKIITLAYEKLDSTYSLNAKYNIDLNSILSIINGES